jgi:predicted RNase H-like HicB family nuclease
MGSRTASLGSRYAILARLPVRRSFTVVVSFEEGWWKVDVRELPGITAHLSEPDCAEAAAREAIGLALGADPGSFDVDVIMRPREPRIVYPDPS